MELRSKFDEGQTLLLKVRDGSVMYEIKRVTGWEPLLGFVYMVRDWTNNRTASFAECELDRGKYEVESVFASAGECMAYMRKEKVGNDEN